MPKFSIDNKLMQKAKAAYEGSLTPENQMLRDPIITTFGIAIKMAGFAPVLVGSSGCIQFSKCPECDNSYLSQYTKDDVLYKACPHCNKITVVGGSNEQAS